MSATDARFDINAYTKIPEGTSHINQAWSGDMVSALSYLPEGTDADVLGYWKPTRTTVANDFFVIPARSERPVLAHSLIDFLLDPDERPAELRVRRLPARAARSPTPDDLIAAELVPEQPRWPPSSRTQDVTDGYRLDALSPATSRSSGRDAYSRITAG